MPGFDFDPNKIYAPTASAQCDRMIMAEAVTRDEELHHVDVEHAFI